jgi:protein involved in polysaccharide export with SLBB domain
MDLISDGYGGRRLVMPYLVRAEVAKPGSGTFMAEAETIRAAFEQARGLRSHGFVVQIMDPVGRKVDETSELKQPG